MDPNWQLQIEKDLKVSVVIKGLKISSVLEGCYSFATFFIIPHNVHLASLYISGVMLIALYAAVFETSKSICRSVKFL